MALSESSKQVVVVAKDPFEVFKMGNIAVTLLNVEKSNPCAPPKPLLIVTPTDKGSYPVIYFNHGFCLLNSFYSQLLQLIASHGYIVVAPQLYTMLTQISGPVEIEWASKVINWLSSELQSLLPENIIPNLQKLSLLGHSRGGKTVFALALGCGNGKTPLNLKPSALIGLDPVAGNCVMRTEPHILTKQEESFNISIPVAVIGTGLGPEKKNLFSCPCAPDDYNYKEFFRESKPTRAKFVAANYGHMDILNDHTPGITGCMASSMCKNGKGPKEYMRMCCSGIVVAFLKAYLDSDKTYLSAIYLNPGIAPVKLVDVEIQEKSSAEEAKFAG